MPELCRFDGFGVYIYPGDHDPPHFHARRADFRVKVDISTIAVTKGGCREISNDAGLVSMKWS